MMKKSIHRTRSRHLLAERCIYFTVAFALMAFSSGCGRGDGIERATVSGTVTLDGEPLPLGNIRFIPTGDNKGPMWSAWIKEGRYTTEGRKGSPVGELRIEILGYRPSGGGPVNLADHDEGGAPIYNQYLPAKYNTQSELRMNIPAGSSRVEKNWEVTSK